MNGMMQLMGVKALGVSVKKRAVRAQAQTAGAIAVEVLAIQRRAKSHAKVDTGAMQGSIQAIMPGQPLVFYNDETKARQTMGKLGKLEGAVTAGMPYSAPVEFGTSRSRAQPFMRPAIAGERNAYRDRVRRAMNKTGGDLQAALAMVGPR